MRLLLKQDSCEKRMQQKVYARSINGLLGNAPLWSAGFFNITAGQIFLTGQRVDGMVEEAKEKEKKEKKKENHARKLYVAIG